MTDQLTSPGRWHVDPDRSTVGWSVKHLGVSTIRGTFRTFEGELEDGRASGAVASSSVRTDDEARDAFVRSEEFLGADAFPLMRFTAQTAPADPAVLEGELTIRETTLPLTLRIVEDADAPADGLALRLHGAVRRRAYGLRFHQAMGAADRSVGDEVELALDLVLVAGD
jgi:polyisoprenoid-binding protein YceI